jgi:hypothetical protein
MDRKKLDKKTIKQKELKIKILTHELLAFTLISNASFLVIHQYLFMDSFNIKFNLGLTH